MIVECAGGGEPSSGKPRVVQAGHRAYDLAGSSFSHLASTVAKVTGQSGFLIYSAQSDFASSEIVDPGLYLQFASLKSVADDC